MLPRRKSAQRAASTLKRLALHQMSIPGGDKEEEEEEEDASEGSESSSEEMSFEEEDDEEEEGDVSEGISDDDDVVGGKRSAEFSKAAKTQRHCQYNTKGIYDDLITQPKPLLLASESEFEEIEVTDTDSITINGSPLTVYTSRPYGKFSLGYAGGTPFISRWLPDSPFLLLAVSTTSHIHNYSAPRITAIQIWEYQGKTLRFISSIDLGTQISDLVVYPAARDGCFVVAFGTEKGITLVTLRLSSEGQTSPGTLNPGSHYKLYSPSLSLTSHSPVTALAFSAVPGGPTSMLGGLFDGHVLQWNLPQGQLIQGVPAHPLSPIRQVVVSVQEPHRFATTATDSRLQFWDIRQMGRSVDVREKMRKQFMMPMCAQWIALWSQVLLLQGTPAGMEAGGKLNSSLLSFPEKTLERPMEPTFPAILPREIKDRIFRCFHYDDRLSLLATGTQDGVAVLSHIPWLGRNRRKGNGTIYAEKTTYLVASVTTAAGLEEEEGEEGEREVASDQEILHHHEFSVVLLSDPPGEPGPLKRSSYRRKNLTSVTTVQLTHTGEVVVGFMAGHFAVRSR